MITRTIPFGSRITRPGSSSPHPGSPIVNWCLVQIVYTLVTVWAVRAGGAGSDRGDVDYNSCAVSPHLTVPNPAGT